MEICQLCEKPTTHIGPCDGFGYKGDCSLCTGFVHRDDGTLVHDDGTIFAPVEEIQRAEFSYRLKLHPPKPEPLGPCLTRSGHITYLGMQMSGEWKFIEPVGWCWCAK